MVLFGLVYLSAGFLISASYAMFMNVARGRWRDDRGGTVTRDLLANGDPLPPTVPCSI